MPCLGALSRIQALAVHRSFPSVRPTQLLNWGEYANVYRLNPDSVLKVTTCPESYRLIRALQTLPDTVCPGVFPEVLADHGQIRKGVWALETERLRPLPRSSRERQVFTMLARTYYRWMENNQAPNEVEDFLRDTRRHLARELRVCGLEPVWKGLELLGSYVAQRPDTALDLKPSNFMVREDTGEVVINDPLFVPEWEEIEIDLEDHLALLQSWLLGR